MSRDSKRPARHARHARAHEALLRRARAEGTPLLDPAADPSLVQATFVFAGRTQPRLIGDFNDWAESEAEGATILMQSAGPGVWAHRMALPRDAYVEYAFAVGRRRRNDTFNRNRTDNGVGNVNTFAYMPGAQPEPRAQRGRGVPAGEVTRHTLDGGDGLVGGRRTVYLYRPAANGPVPLLVVHDGVDYLRRANLPEIVDNLIAERRIRPIALAMLDNHSEARFIEYACSDAHAAVIGTDLMALARRHLDLTEARGEHGLLGASMGGVMALYSAFRAPHLFGKVLAQSGAFSVGDDHSAEHDLVIFDLIEHAPRRPLRIYMDVGSMEWLLPTNRRMRDVLLAKGYPVRYREYSGGHNYPAWRDDLAAGLMYLFGAD